MKKKLSILLIVIIVLTCSGCGNSKYVTNKDKQLVKNEETGQTVRNDILCKPADKNLVKIYTENEQQLQTSLKKLPECKKFKTTSIKYHSLWESVFVKPLAWIILKTGYLVKNFGLAVMLIGALIRIIMLPLSKKSLDTSKNMQKAQPELAKIEKKYKDKTDRDSMMAKSQETMLVYKKYNINPMMGCVVTFIQLPLFFAFLEAINRVPAIFEGKFLGLNLGTNSLIGITTGSIGVKVIYIVILLLIMLTTYMSFKNNMAANNNVNNEATKQMQMMSKFMIIMISIISITLPVAIALYWIVTNGIMTIQNVVVNRKK